MTATTTEIQHQPWCVGHAAPADGADPSDSGSCSREWGFGGGHFVNIEEENGVPYVAVWGNGDPMTPHDARRMAVAIIEAADTVDGRSQGSAVVVRNVAALVAARSSLCVSDVEGLAAVFGVPVSDLLREDYDPSA